MLGGEVLSRPYSVVQNALRKKKKKKRKKREKKGKTRFRPLQALLAAVVGDPLVPWAAEGREGGAARKV